MLALNKFKEALGSLKNELSEEEILELRENQDQMAEIFFAMWLEEVKNNKNEV